MLSTARKANPKLIIKIWKSYISDKYLDEITRGDITFFIENYNQDLKNLDNSARVLQSIEGLREPISEMAMKIKKSLEIYTKFNKTIKLYFRI